MSKLETSYLGLKLKNPIVIASSGLTKDVKNIEECERAGAGAVVVKSVFEEVLVRDFSKLEKSYEAHAEAYDHLLSSLEVEHGFEEYVELIQKAKEKVNIPVIASINCTSDFYWPEFAAKLEKAGADALELNVFSVVSYKRRKGTEIEEMYYNILKKVKEHIKIPIAMKISPNFTSLPNVIHNLDEGGLNGVVLFNRFTEPEIDINNLELDTTFTFTRTNDYHQSLRWTAILSGQTKLDIAATTGIHSWQTVIKLLLAGASVTQSASLFYEKGLGEINNMLPKIEEWMDKHNFASIADFKGKLNFRKIDSPQLYLRSQFVDKIKNIL